jgi:protein-S-isoprenylcysteine O-methyltransferase Ste14
MRATNVEFRLRFWFIAAIFWLGFELYAIDHVTMAYALADSISLHTTAPHRDIVKAVFGLAALIGVAAALLRTWAASLLHSSVVHDADLHANRLVADGPYRYVRNPLYVGTILLSIGMGLLASRLGFGFIVCGMVVFVLRLIGREEEELTASQGEPYRRYRAAVPRLIPSLLPLVAAGGGHPQWLQALLGETFMWGFAASMAVFAITLNQSYFWRAMIATFVLYLASKGLLRAQRAEVKP